MITPLPNFRTSAIPCSRTSAIRRLKTCIPWLWIVTIAPKHTRSGYARWQFLDAKITRAQMTSCSHETPGRNFSTAHPSMPGIRIKSLLHRIDRGARWSMNKSSPGRTRKSSLARMFAIISCGVVRHRLSSAAHREHCSDYRTASEAPMEKLRAITWERHITWMPVEVSTKVYGLFRTHWGSFGLFLGLMFNLLHMLFLTWIYVCLFLLASAQTNADWLTIPILIEYNKQRLHLEIAFSFPAFFAFLFFLCVYKQMQTTAFVSLSSVNMLPLRLDPLSSPSCPSSIGQDPWGRTTLINTHLRTYRDTSQLGLLLHIFCPPVCISRLHTYLISLFGYLLAMKRIEISRIRSNSTPVLALDINITAIPISFKSLLRQRRYIYIYIFLSFFSYYIYLYIYLSTLL